MDTNHNKLPVIEGCISRRAMQDLRVGDYYGNFVSRYRYALVEVPG